MEYRSHGARRLFRRVGLSPRFALGVMIVAAVHVAASAAADNPSRGFWVSRSALSSSQAIRRAMSSAVSGGFDAIVMPIAAGALGEADPFDGEAELMRQARESGLGVHLAIAVTVAAAVGELPASRDHVIYQHPEWLMVPRQLAPEVLGTDVRSPAYLGQIARWTRVNADRVDGLYVSPLDPAAAAYLTETVVAAAQRRAADGVYLDAIDFPGTDFDYSRHTTDIFRARLRPTLSASERTRLDEVEAIDPFAYQEEFPEEWRQFRESALTQLLVRIRTGLTSAKPSLSVTVGTRSEAGIALRDHFQNWRAWLNEGVVSRIGYRGRSTPAVLFSSDGVMAPDPARTPTVQATGVGGPR